MILVRQFPDNVMINNNALAQDHRNTSESRWKVEAESDEENGRFNSMCLIRNNIVTLITIQGKKGNKTKLLANTKKMPSSFINYKANSKSKKLLILSIGPKTCLNRARNTAYCLSCVYKSLEYQ